MTISRPARKCARYLRIRLGTSAISSANLDAREDKKCFPKRSRGSFFFLNRDLLHYREERRMAQMSRNTINLKTQQIILLIRTGNCTGYTMFVILRLFFNNNDHNSIVPITFHKYTRRSIMYVPLHKLFNYSFCPHARFR